MSLYFSNPYLMLLAPLIAVLLIARRKQPAAVALRRNRLKRVFQCAAVAALTLAAAGLRFPARAPWQVLAVAADGSESVFDLATQSARLNQMLSALSPDQAQAAVVVFGRAPGLERAMGPLPRLATTAASRMLRQPRAESEATRIDLVRPATVVDRSATDIGGAINFARGLFPASETSAARAILLLSDFRDTVGSAEAAAAALAGSGIDLLCSPAVLGPSADVHIAALRLPEMALMGRDLPIEVTVASQTPCTVQVAVLRQRHGAEPVPVDFKKVILAAEPGTAGAEIRKVVRILDRPDAPGVAVYTARISGVEGDLPNDISLNNQLSAAVRISGPSRWAALARPGSTLESLCAHKGRRLGVEVDVFATSALPRQAADYERYVGILVDGLSALELSDGPALRALADAVSGGKALVALGGERAFGAGGHREGTWESLLPVEMTPEDDRARSVLFLIDVSKSMEQRMGSGGSGVRKLDFAAEQLAQAVQKLKPLDRLGLITFSGTAQLAAPLSTEPSHAAFLNAVKNIAIQANTDIHAALKQAQETLKSDAAEEQLVVLLSDGIQTAQTPADEIIAAAKALCPLREGKAPRRTTLFTFGIGIDPRDANATGEKLMKALAEAGGGTYSPDFLKLAERLEQAFEAQKKDFYSRRERFVARAAYDHPLAPSGTQWPALPFRNRVKAKPQAEAILWSARLPSLDEGERPGEKGQRKPDPLLVLSGSQWPSASRRAALALSLDGEAGAALLNSEGGRALLPALLEWSEAKPDDSRAGWTVSVDEGSDDTISIEVRASDPATRRPVSGRRLFAALTPLQLDSSSLGRVGEGGPPRLMLHPSAPGVYRALIPKPAQGVYRLAINESPRLPDSQTPRPPDSTVYERFITVPYSAELLRFGTDRAAMQNLVAKAGGSSRVIERPEDLARWAAEKAMARDMYSLRGWLVALGMGLLLAEYAGRGRR